MAATDLERLVVSLDADIRKFEKELKRANNIADGQFRNIERRGTRATKNLSNSFGGLGGIGAAAFGGLTKGMLSALAPAVLLTGAIVKTRKALADLGKLADDIKPTGLNPEIYQALSLAALEAGSSQEELNAALLIFAKNVGLAQSGTGPLIAGLKRLNPELLKNILAAKDQDTRIRLVAEAMKQAGSATRQAALASVAFGRGGVKIVESLKGGSAAIDAYIAKAKELGILFTREDLLNADELADKVDFLSDAINKNLNKALINLAPLIGAAAQETLEFTQELNRNIEAIEKFANNPGLSTLDDLLGVSLREGSFADQLRDFFAGGVRGAAEIKVEIAEVEAELKKLEQQASEGFPVGMQTVQAREQLKTLQEELAKVATIAQQASAAANAALSTIGADPRAGGFAFQSQRESENAAARDFFAARQADAGRTSAQRELDAKAEEVLNKAKEEGIELTEAAARAEAERELGLEKLTKETEKSVGGTDALKESNDLREQQHQLIRDTIASLSEETAAIGFETQHINDTNAVRERARVVFETLNRLQAEGITITNELRAAVEREADARFHQVSTYDAAAAAADELARAQEDLAAQQAEINDAFRDSMKGFISDLAHGKSLTDALTNALGRLGDRLLDLALDNLFGKSGDSGFGLLGQLFSGGGGGGATPFKTNSTLSSVLGVGGSAFGGASVTSAPQITGAVSKGVTSGLKAAGDVPGTIWNFFTNKGFAPHQVAGILGNVSAESAFNPRAVGDSGNAFGLFQHNDRAPALFNAIGGRENLGDTTRQLEFAWKELLTTERKALEALKASTNVREATGAFAGFERPRGFSWDNPEGAHNFEGRVRGAEEALAKLGGTTGQATSSVVGFGNGTSSALSSLSSSVSDVTGNLGQFGSSLASFLSSTSGGGSSWFKNLAGLFGGTGGALNYMNSISPLATMSILSGAGGLFAEGGYTGDIGTKTPAGIVHGGEFVMNANATARNRALLEALNNGLPGYAAGGFVLPRLRRAAGSGNLGRRGTTNVAITVVTPDAPSFMRSQNQIAAKTAATVDRAFRTQ